MHRLLNAVQGYAWGSRTAIAELRGHAPTGAPEAELWMGAHAALPSKLEASGHALGDVIRDAPEKNLGAESVRRFGPRLPFLFKVLAAAEPLSLQAHPTKAQAEEGFAREEAAGIPLTAPHRNYKDRDHKPEILCALTPFWALCGFRDLAATRELVASLKSEALRALAAPLGENRPNALREVFFSLVNLAPPEAAALVMEVTNGCKLHVDAGGAFSDSCRWATRLSQLYPGDAGVVVSLLMNVVELAPGEAIYLPAGNLHAYLEGTGMELMASSDNVLRGGLTKKHVDVPELSRVLDFAARPVSILRGEAISDEERVYRTPAPEFELSVITTGGATTHAGGGSDAANDDAHAPFPRRGAEILFVTRGEARIRARNEAFLKRGDAVYVPYDEGPFTLGGSAEIMRASVGRI